MDQERFQPQWGTLKESMRQRREILEEVLQQKECETAEQGSSAQMAFERDRYAMIAGAQEGYIHELEEALWIAEEVLRGVGRKPPTRNEQIVAAVRFLRHCARLDQEEAMEREVVGAEPLPAEANVVCGKEGMTTKEAVKRVLTALETYDRNGQRRSPERVNELVEAQLEKAIKANSRSRKK